jgi:hypothetical protein
MKLSTAGLDPFLCLSCRGSEFIPLGRSRYVCENCKSSYDIDMRGVVLFLPSFAERRAALVKRVTELLAHDQIRNVVPRSGREAARHVPSTEEVFSHARRELDLLALASPKIASEADLASAFRRLGFAEALLWQLGLLSPAEAEIA